MDLFTDTHNKNRGREKKTIRINFEMYNRNGECVVSHIEKNQPIRVPWHDFFVSHFFPTFCFFFFVFLFFRFLHFSFRIVRASMWLWTRSSKIPNPKHIFVSTNYEHTKCWKGTNQHERIQNTEYQIMCLQMICKRPATTFEYITKRSDDFTKRTSHNWNT